MRDIFIFRVKCGREKVSHNDDERDSYFCCHCCLKRRARDDFWYTHPSSAPLQLAVPGCIIGVSCYLEGAAVCKRWADEDGEVFDSDKELVAQGVSNITSAFLGGMTVAGVISRAAFGKVAGARTRLAHGVTGVLIIAFIVANGGALLAFLPKACLGALVGCGVLPLMTPTHILRPDNFAALTYEGARRDVHKNKNANRFDSIRFLSDVFLAPSALETLRHLNTDNVCVSPPPPSVRCDR